MLIEEEITQLIRSDHYHRLRLYYGSNKDPHALDYDYEQPFSIEDWTWSGKPLAGHATPLCEQINALIKDHPLEMCLTSPSEYIRECKKWYESQKKGPILCLVD
jgi:hypothetical protein